MNQEEMVQAVDIHEEANQEFCLDDTLENTTNWIFYLFLIMGIPLILSMIFQLV